MAIVKTDSIHYSNIAAKIREKTGEATKYPPAEMPSGIDAVYEAGKSAGGGNPYEYLDALVEGATEITSYASIVAQNVFQGNTKLEKVTFPVVTEIVAYAFHGATKLTEVYAPEATHVRNYAFMGVSKLQKAEVKKAVSFGNAAFSNCTSLASLTCESVEYIGNSAINNTGLAELYAPNTTQLADNSITNNKSLRYIELGPLNSKRYIYRNTFNGDTSLIALVMRVSSQINLENVNAFNNTPIASGEGYIYIPSALIPNFQTATNWSTFANQFRALEDYTVDGTVTGAFDRTKI